MTHTIANDTTTVVITVPVANLSASRLAHIAELAKRVSGDAKVRVTATESHISFTMAEGDFVSKNDTAKTTVLAA
jgi:hypothetical protein